MTGRLRRRYAAINSGIRRAAREKARRCGTAGPSVFALTGAYTSK